MEIDETYMRRCLQLASCGRGAVAPNPMVGAVLVCNGKIIGEGYHRRCGEAHAEVNAIESVKNESLLKRATLYISLEPCSHYGKTPPCAELIIRKGIPRVVVACLDPFPKVSGNGIKMLQEAGIEVACGVLEEEARELNRYFITAHILQRPYIILKWAQSSNGFIDAKRTTDADKPVHISNDATTRYMHRLRSEIQAIMVGTETAVLDNPSLTTRHWYGTSPLRIVIDRNLRIPHSHNLFDGSHKTLVVTTQQSINTTNATNGKNLEYIAIDDDIHFLRNLTTILYERNIQSILVEGGAKLHQSFISEDLWDEAVIETSPIIIENGIRAASIKTFVNPVNKLHLGKSAIEKFRRNNI